MRYAINYLVAVELPVLLPKTVLVYKKARHEVSWLEESIFVGVKGMHICGRPLGGGPGA